MDKFIVQTRGNLNDQRAVQTALKVKAASVHFSDQFFNGDVEVNPKGFDGSAQALVRQSGTRREGDRPGHQRA
ncbi:hypothetical protein ACO0M4_36145 [Streptomyces sp. RGM 3693]|uniref:hypothetical protein n=1 Tax=Streptomyces sp. RGM 3693 TaxID=3413284 RepID=UPI003D2A1A94